MLGIFVFIEETAFLFTLNQLYDIGDHWKFRTNVNFVFFKFLSVI